MVDRTEHAEDMNLVMKWKGGDPDAAEALLNKYMPLIMSLARKTSSAAELEDARQDLILAFLSKAKDYEPSTDASFAGYMAKGLRWASLDRAYKEQYREEHEELTLDDQDETALCDTYPEEALPTLSYAAELAHLTRKQTAVFLLWMQGKDTKAICKELGIQRTSLTRMKKNILGRLQRHKKEFAKRLYD